MHKTKQGHILTKVILDAFHLNGVLTHAGDQLTQEFGLSSARWKVLGAIAESKHAMSVAEIARQMGLTRQAVQRLSNEMVKDGLLQFKINPNHQRAKFVLLSKLGMRIYHALENKQTPWVNGLSEQFSMDELHTTSATLEKLIQLIESNQN